MKKAVIFDYVGVIKGMPGPAWSKKVADILGVSKDEFKSVYHRHNHRFNIGDKSFSDVLSDMAKELGREDKLKEVLKFISEPAQLNQNVIELIRNLKEKKYKVGLLSNNSKESAKIMRAEGIEELFDVLCVSEEVGLAKPDKAAYIDILKKLDVTPEDSIYIDDVEKNIEVATELGFDSILFRSYDELIQELTQKLK